MIDNDYYQLRWGVDNKDIEGTSALYLLRGFNTRALITGDNIISSTADKERDQFIVNIQMNDLDTDRWAKITDDYTGKILGIVIDDVVYTVPRVAHKIEGGKSSISGQFTKEQAEELAAYIALGGLSLTVTIVE